MSCKRLALSALLMGLCAAGSQAGDAPRWSLPEARSVQLAGPLGAAFERGVKRLGEEPYQSVVFLRSDVSFEMERWFTNYSGDISGRFIEIASMTSPRGTMAPEALSGLLESITGYQRPDGHYGIDIDWSKPLERADVKTPRMMPIFWGNGRLLVGLLEAWRTFGDARLLESARRMGDFYIATADTLMDPARDAEYRATGTYAPGYVTCYFHGMEGLVRLYQATGGEKYLQQAERMAEFLKRYDTLPLDHSHGNLSEYHAIMMLHRETGRKEHLERAVARWEEVMKGGYVAPIGGVGELFKPAFKRDEGCSEADWLRLNLDLWEATGQTRYLDTAERLLLNHYAMNRTPNGGYGHHVFECDDQGPLLMQPKFEEAVWCCTFHGLMSMNNLRRYLVAGSERGVFVNFPLDVATSVNVGREPWRVAVKPEAPQAGQASFRVSVAPEQGEAGKRPAVFVRVPGWAQAASAADGEGKPLATNREDGYLKLEFAPESTGEAVVTFTFAPRLEDRRMNPVALKGEGIQRLPGVVLCSGPRVLLAAADKPKPVLILPVDKDGKLVLPEATAEGFQASVAPAADASQEQILAAMQSGAKLQLADWEHVKKDGNVAFVFDVIAVPQAEK